MAWTTPRTWSTGEVVTAALLNAQIKGNMDLSAPAIMTTAGDIIYASGANTPARLAKDTNATRVLTNTGTSNVPAWAQVTLTSGVTGTLPVANGGTGITSLGSNVATFLGTPSSANLRSALTDETGTGGAVFATSPTLVTPALGTPASGTLTNCTGLPTAGIVADAVTGAKIADDAIDSEHYTDGSIDTAHIADNQVTAAKLADIARGSIIYGNASAATAELTKGSANTILTSDGTDISWAAPAASGKTAGFILAMSR
tara:strand:+ start:154 stop:927 length:774 start_codon:yes stop_codon:yes gene_type:complete